jgi:hypothetical protein
MVLPVAEFPLAYHDVYTLEIPFAPPPEVHRQFNSQQQAQLARLFHAPKATHNLRLTNDSPYPLTTAPAIILQQGRLLGQGLMTYAATGSRSDLSITTAVDIAVHKRDVETARTPNAAQWGGHAYDRVDLEGRIKLSNYRAAPAELEVVRHVLGNAAAASHDGRVEKINVHEEALQVGSGFPDWWGWYSWPYWWNHLNGISQIRWSIKLPPGENIELTYRWHYFWRG